MNRWRFHAIVSFNFIFLKKNAFSSKKVFFVKGKLTFCGLYYNQEHHIRWGRIKRDLPAAVFPVQYTGIPRARAH
ncbi:MAG: hypothetical protein FADNKDHG_00390 [Holosporales bacterium]